MQATFIYYFERLWQMFSAEGDPAAKLPEELIISILGHLDTQSLLQVRSVSRTYKRLADTESLWKNLYLWHFRNAKIPLTANEKASPRPWFTMCMEIERVRRLSFENCKSLEIECDASSYVLDSSSDRVFQVFNEFHTVSCNCGGNWLGFGHMPHERKAQVWNISTRKLVGALEAIGYSRRGPTFIHAFLDRKKGRLIGLATDLISERFEDNTEVRKPTFISSGDVSTNSFQTSFPINIDTATCSEAYRSDNAELHFDPENELVVFHNYVINLQGKQVLTIPRGQIHVFDAENKFIFATIPGSQRCILGLFETEAKDLYRIIHKQEINFQHVHKIAYDKARRIVLFYDKLSLNILHVSDFDDLHRRLVNLFTAESGKQIAHFYYDQESGFCFVHGTDHLLRIYSVDSGEIIESVFFAHTILEIKYDHRTRTVLVAIPKGLYLWDLINGRFEQKYTVEQGYFLKMIEWRPGRSSIMLHTVCEPDGESTIITKNKIIQYDCRI